MQTEKELTYGQKAVGLTFNPSKDPEVDRIKQLYADIIDTLSDLRNKTSSSEMRRHCSVAITDAETAQMRAVKALTWKDDISTLERNVESYKPVDYQKDVIEYSNIVPVVLDFFTVRCGPCINLMKPLEELAAKMGFGLVKANCDKEIALARQFEVRSVPRLVIFHRGEVVWDSKDHHLNTQGRLDAIAFEVKKYQGA